MMENLYNNVRENVRRISAQIANAAIISGREPHDVSLMAVTKTVTPELVNIAIEEGITLLGENKAQEMLTKIDKYDNNANIHFIGALQSNKVKQIIDHVSMIQSVDRLSLLKEIEKQSSFRDKVTDILIEINIGEEKSKAGILPADVMDFAQLTKIYSHINLRGLMCIPPLKSDRMALNRYFFKMRQYLVDIQSKNVDNSSIDVLSMGMSADFLDAIKNGATIVRIGSALFGNRL